MGFIPERNDDGSLVAGRMKKIFVPEPNNKPLCSESEFTENNTFIHDLPYTLLGNFTNEDLMLRVVDINMRIRDFYDKKK